MDPATTFALIQVFGPTIGPTVAIVVLGLLVNSKIRVLTQDIGVIAAELRTVKQETAACQKERREAEKELHEKVSDVATEQAHLNGLLEARSG